MNFRPMLAAPVEDTDKLVFPLIGTPKIDGIRCITLEPDEKGMMCNPVTRSLKKIPNFHVWEKIAKSCVPGLDGELIVPQSTFQGTSSAIMSHHGKPEFNYLVFDHLREFLDPRWTRGHMERYAERLKRLEDMKWQGQLRDFCVVLEAIILTDLDDLEDYEEDMVSNGHEGICLRSPHSPYKFGRSTFREHWLMKMKRFVDAEAKVIGFVELLHNENEDKPCALGYKRRHSFQAGMTPGKTLGALEVRDLATGVEFYVGTGFTEGQRQIIWNGSSMYLGKTITYKHQPHGAKDKPRSPVFKGFRPAE